MQVLANDQTGHTLLTRVRAYLTRARTSKQSMNMPFNVSVRSNAGGKINRQDLPIQTLKTDEAGRGGSPAAPGHMVASRTSTIVTVR